MIFDFKSNRVPYNKRQITNTLESKCLLLTVFIHIFLLFSEAGKNLIMQTVQFTQSRRNTSALLRRKPSRRTMIEVSIRQAGLFIFEKSIQTSMKTILYV